MPVFLETSSEGVRAGARFIAQVAKQVKINQDKVCLWSVKVLEAMRIKGYDGRNPQDFPRHPLYPHIAPDDPNLERREAILNWVFVVDLLNFSFWSNEPYTVEFDGQRYTGYWSLCAAINRALAAGCPITTPSYYATASRDELRRAFQAEVGQMPLVEERITILQNAGQLLMLKYDGRLSRAFEQFTNPQGVIIIDLLIEWLNCSFHSFLDVTWYAAGPISFMKRAQIIIADLWMAMEGSSPWGKFDDLSKLTMFADYRVPQVLMALGVLEVSDELMKRLRREELLSIHDDAVIELRGCAIEAVERMRQEMKDILEGGEEGERIDPGTANTMINAAIIDFYLWDLAKAQPELLTNVPFHRTRSHFY